MGRILLLALLVAGLSGCNIDSAVVTSPDDVSFAANVDANLSVAIFTCKSSPTGVCTFRFADATVQPQAITVVKGQTGTVTGIKAGTGYCATSGGQGATCKDQTLQDGKQTIRRESHSTS